MQLKSVRVRNFRSIKDSGTVATDQVTALVGRNESGKSNLLLAIESLSPSSGFAPLNPIKNFPRDRSLSECNDDTPVLDTIWTLSDADRAKLAELHPGSGEATEVTICRYYGKKRTVDFNKLIAPAFDLKTIGATWRKLRPAIVAAAGEPGGAARNAIETACATVEPQIVNFAANGKSWADRAKPHLASVRQGLANHQARLADPDDQLLSSLEQLCQDLIDDHDAAGKARNWAIEQLPVMIYLEDYPDLEGTTNIAEYINRKSNGQLTSSDRYFEKLCKVSGLNPQQLNDLHNNGDEETRNQLVNRAGAVITGEIRRLWKDRQLQVRFNIDGPRLSTYVADPNSDYPVEVNFDERSRGFRWFFAFYVSFAADTKGGSAERAVLLLDEPGLYLHALSQADLLKHLRSDFKNQIIYTTHSPFMVPTDALESVRTVDITPDKGTQVAPEFSTDARTLFPLQAALGYDIAQNLFIGSSNVVLEGVTDFWLLSAASDYLREIGRTGLDPKITLTPAGTAQKIPYMVALLASQRLGVVAVFDDEKQARQTTQSMIKENVIRDEGVIFVSAAFPTAPKEADIEDLLDPATYDNLVMQTHAAELSGKTLSLNANIPRIAKRYEAAFEELDLSFNKTKPLRAFMRAVATDAANLLPAPALDRFEKLIVMINKAVKTAKPREPFK